MDYEVGASGIQRDGGLKISLGHVLRINGEPRIYTPFSLTVPCMTFFGTNLLKDVQATTSRDNVRLKVSEPSPLLAFGDILRLIKYKRSKEGRQHQDNLLRQIDNQYAIDIRVTEGALQPGDTIHVTIGATRMLTAPIRETAWQVIVRADGNGDGSYGLLPDLPRLRAYTTEVDQAVLIAPGTLYPGEQDKVLCRIQDDYFLPNLSHFESGTLYLDRVEGLSFPDSVSIHGQDGGLQTFPVRALLPGIYRITGRAIIREETFPVMSNPIQVIPAGGQKLFFGDIHSHSVISYDADRPPEYVYWRHKNQEGHDFAALSDHDMIGAVPFADRNAVLGRSREEWESLKTLANQYNEPGDFITLLAYEWTSYDFGHRNIYFSPREADPPLFHHNRLHRTLPEQLRDALGHNGPEGHEYITVPHSTAWQTAQIFYRWGPKKWIEQRLLELYSTHGTSEYFDNPYAVDEGHWEVPTESQFIKGLMNYNIRQAPANSGNFAQDALADGRQFGFLGSGDMHYLSHLNQAYGPGLMAVYARGLTREEIWDAMYQRRTYATTGVRMLVDFRVEGHPMGSIISVRERGVITITGEVHGSGPLDQVTVVKFDGREYSDLYTQRLTGEWDFTFSAKDTAARAGNFYYLRARQQDDNTAWSSPIWLEESGDTSHLH